VNKVELDPQFSILHGLQLDTERRLWIERRETVGNNCGAEVNTGQISTSVEILRPGSHNILTITEEYLQ
jgi:hypothetical protein